MSGQTPFSQIFPPPPKDYQSPWYYASLQSFWLYYLVDPDVLCSRLATLPAPEVLRAQLAAAVFAPLTTIIGLFTAPLRDFVGVIDARIRQLEEQGEAVPEAEAAEAPAEEPEAEAPAEEAQAEAAAEVATEQQPEELSADAAEASAEPEEATRG